MTMAGMTHSCRRFLLMDNWTGIDELVHYEYIYWLIFTFDINLYNIMKHSIVHVHPLKWNSSMDPDHVPQGTLNHSIRIPVVGNPILYL